MAERQKFTSTVEQEVKRQQIPQTKKDSYGPPSNYTDVHTLYPYSKGQQAPLQGHCVSQGLGPRGTLP